MKKFLLLLALFALLNDSKANASFSLTQWPFYKEISNVSEGLSILEPDSEIFSQANDGLSDIRIVDSKNNEVPYKLIINSDQTKIEDSAVTILNNSVVSEKYRSAVLNVGSKGKLINKIAIGTKSENFQRQVKIYGSDDQINWNLLIGDGLIYDFTDKRENVKAQKLFVEIPESTYQFYRFEIQTLDDKPVKIENASVSKFISEQQSSNEAIIKQIKIDQNDSSKTTEILLDFAQSGIPINLLKLNTADSNYNRGVSVYSSSNSESKDWNFLGHGYIFKYNTDKFKGENNELKFSQTNDRFIKIVIYNNDNKPLNVFDVKSYYARRELVFNGSANESYRLFYGNKKAAAAHYDLESYYKYLDLNQAKKVEIGPQKINQSFQPEKKPVTERYPNLLTTILVVACLFLLILVYKFFKKSS